MRSKSAEIEVADRVKELLTDPKLMSLKNHVALVVALMERAVNKLDVIEVGDKSDALETAKSVGAISTNLARVVETQHKISVGYYYSPEKLKIIMDMIGNTMNSYCRDCPKLQEVAVRLKELPMPE